MSLFSGDGTPRSNLTLKLTTQSMAVPVADGRSGVTEVAVSSLLADSGGVEEARVTVMTTGPDPGLHWRSDATTASRVDVEG